MQCVNIQVPTLLIACLIHMLTKLTLNLLMQQQLSFCSISLTKRINISPTHAHTAWSTSFWEKRLAKACRHVWFLVTCSCRNSPNVPQGNSGVGLQVQWGDASLSAPACYGWLWKTTFTQCWMPTWLQLIPIIHNYVWRSQCFPNHHCSSEHFPAFCCRQLSLTAWNQFS